MVLDAFRDFYINCLDDARQAIAASRSQPQLERAGRERSLAAIEEELAAKEDTPVPAAAAGWGAAPPVGRSTRTP